MSKSRKSTVIEKTDDKIKEICFVIMPFGGWFDSYYSEIYCQAINEAGMIPQRADDLYRPSNIVQDIWNLTKQARIILADLSNKNPNVFYELGLAHALAKPAILITQNMDDIPFDLRGLRIIEYDKNRQNWGDYLKKSIKQAILETIKSPNETIPAAFLEINETTKRRISKEEKELLEIRQEIDSIKRKLFSHSKAEFEINLSKKASGIEEKLKEVYANMLAEKTLTNHSKLSFEEDMPIPG
jgi:hypothetical protein